MGSPISALVAEMVMETVEDNILQCLPSIRIWKRYVDDAFAIILRTQADHILTEINRLCPRGISFTMETEKQGSIPFLDILDNTRWYRNVPYKSLPQGPLAH